MPGFNMWATNDGFMSLTTFESPALHGIARDRKQTASSSPTPTTSCRRSRRSQPRAPEAEPEPNAAAVEITTTGDVAVTGNGRPCRVGRQR